jgi:hypothetical protein
MAVAIATRPDALRRKSRRRMAQPPSMSSRVLKFVRRPKFLRDEARIEKCCLVVR